MEQSALSRRTYLGLMGAGGVSTLLSGWAQAPLNAAQRGDKVTRLLDQIAWHLLEHYPEQATALGIDKGSHDNLRHKLENKTPRGVARLAAQIESDLKAVRHVNDKELDDASRTSLDVVDRAYSTALEGFALPYGEVAVGGWRNTPYVVIQNVGAYLDIPRFLDASHPVISAEDAEAYLDRLAKMAQQLGGERERVLMAHASGLVPPDFLIDRTLAQMDQTIRDLADGGVLVQSLEKRTASIPGNWSKRAKQIVDTAVLPALQKQLETLQYLRSFARSEPGLRERPFGEQWYAWGLKAATTTTLFPVEIHAQGLEELAVLHTQMDPILHSLGFTKGTVGERMAALSRDPRFKFAAGDPGRSEIMAFLRKQIDWITAQMPRAFRTLASGNVDVRRLPLAEEPGAPSAYGGAGSIDGSVPGKMWINLSSTDLHRQYDLPTLVHHETIPGHVWQGEFANQLPLIRSILQFNPYSEGWALYAEQLADELGAYDDNPVGRLGYLQSLAFRACRMVVDTGLHALGWTREQAIAFVVESNGNSPTEIAGEVNRYCSWPGQACGYKMGHSEIVRLRALSQDRLGNQYDMRDFNQAIVTGGNVPLDVLGENVERYINNV